MPAWIRCTGCENFWCTIHEMHAHDCPCPPIEEWDTDRYSGDPPMPVETTPTTIRTTTAERAALDEIAAAWGGDVRPLSRQQTLSEMIRRTLAEVRARKTRKSSRNSSPDS